MEILTTAAMLLFGWAKKEASKEDRLNGIVTIDKPYNFTLTRKFISLGSLSEYVLTIDGVEVFRIERTRGIRGGETKRDASFRGSTFSWRIYPHGEIGSSAEHFEVLKSEDVLFRGMIFGH